MVALNEGILMDYTHRLKGNCQLSTSDYFYMKAKIIKANHKQ